jgi:hypothetical protein
MDSGSASRVNDSTFGIFDAFDDDAARQAHLTGRIPQALAQVGADLLANDPDLFLALPRLWTLLVQDVVAGNSGTIVSWTLTL